jgi:hypothetical protein
VLADLFLSLIKLFSGGKGAGRLSFSKNCFYFLWADLFIKKFHTHVPQSLIPDAIRSFYDCIDL